MLLDRGVKTKLKGGVSGHLTAEPPTPHRQHRRRDLPRDHNQVSCDSATAQRRLKDPSCRQGPCALRRFIVTDHPRAGGRVRTELWQRCLDAIPFCACAPGAGGVTLPHDFTAGCYSDDSAAASCSTNFGHRGGPYPAASPPCRSKAVTGTSKPLSVNGPWATAGHSGNMSRNSAEARICRGAAAATSRAARFTGMPK